jgi:hypothetical protein
MISRIIIALCIALTFTALVFTTRRVVILEQELGQMDARVYELETRGVKIFHEMIGINQDALIVAHVGE